MAQIPKLELRSWVNFADKKSFAVPRSMPIAQHVQVNVKHFQANYLIVIAALCVIASLVHPPFAIFLGIAAAAAIAAFTFRHHPIEIKGFHLTAIYKYIIAALVSLIVLYWTDSLACFFWTSGIALVAIIVHAVFRNHNH